ncbi:MAG: phosphatase PAP2 family protein [Cyclobacteriaceae bacterium]
MKKIYTLILSALLLMAIPFSCKDITSSEGLVPLIPTNVDTNAGTWAPVLVTNNQVIVPAPSATISVAYLAELAAVKDAQSKLTAEQKDIIDYWNVGGVLRWNQIFRKLVAQYNLPPVPNLDGSYPIPDAENPFSNPQFPFANPPYAARAYSYVSVAIYDALKSAWYYKDLYKRPAPYITDNAIQSLMPKIDLPSYPSEEATMSGSAAEMLKVLFPAAVEEITKLAADQRNAAKWAGKATDSDISAGLALGKAVATIMTANSTGVFTIPGASGASTTALTVNIAARGRFRTDGIGAAIGTPAQWKAFADDAIAKGETPWISLDAPARPPMLPFFGNVRAWNLSPTQIASERPLPPPSTSSDKMKQELAEVKSFANNVTREQIAIVHKWADGAGTYTPPGHWNDIAEEYIRDKKYSEVRAARAFALLNMALHDAGVACWNTKYFYFNPRPSQLDPSIKTTTGIPNFPAYVSGHSTFSASAAAVLSYLFPEATNDFNTMADEASNSRLYGAIHYRSDCKEGLSLGKRVGAYTVTFAQADGAN